MKDIASEKLGFTVSIEHGYKLNDFKTDYGYIYSKLVKDYDFGGHMDLDIILGNYVSSWMINGPVHTIEARKRAIIPIVKQHVKKTMVNLFKTMKTYTSFQEVFFII